MRHVAALDPTQYASMNLVWGDARAVSIAYARREAHAARSSGCRAASTCCATTGSAPTASRAAIRLHDAIAAAPRTWPEIAPALQAALADHTQVDPTPAGPSHLPPEIARELTAVCIHAPAYGTRSSTIFAADRGAAIAYLHADGPPCTTPFVDQRALLGATP